MLLCIGNNVSKWTVDPNDFDVSENLGFTVFLPLKLNNL